MAEATMAEKEVDEGLQVARKVLSSKIGDEGILAMQAYITAATEKLEHRIDRNLYVLLTFLVMWTGVVVGIIKLL